MTPGREQTTLNICKKGKDAKIDSEGSCFPSHNRDLSEGIFS